MTTQEHEKLMGALTRAQLVSLVLLGAGTIGFVVLLWQNGVQPTMRGYLTGFVYCWGLAMGFMAMLMIHHLSGGRWGFIVRRPLEAGSMMLFLMLLAFAPIWLMVASGSSIIYSYWLDPAKIASDPVIAYKVETIGYLTTEAWSLRAALYFAIWVGMAFLFYRFSSQQDNAAAGDFSRASWMRILSGGGLVLYVVTMTFATVDWFMSIDPHWFSAMYPVLFIVGQGLSTIALLIILLSFLTRFEPFRSVVNKDRLDEYGKLMLAFVVLWTYVNFGQYVIIWSGNIPEFTPWYVRRLDDTWQVISVLLMLFHFLVPFGLLLSRIIKRNITMLALLAVFVTIMRFVEIFWLIVPDFEASPMPILLGYIATLAMLGGAFLTGLFWLLKWQPVLPENDLRNDPRAMKGYVAHA